MLKTTLDSREGTVGLPVKGLRVAVGTLEQLIRDRYSVPDIWSDPTGP